MSRADDVKRASAFGKLAFRRDLTADAYDERLADLIAEVRAETIAYAVESIASGLEASASTIGPLSAGDALRAYAHSLRFSLTLKPKDPT